MTTKQMNNEKELTNQTPVLKVLELVNELNKKELQHQKETASFFIGKVFEIVLDHLKERGVLKPEYFVSYRCNADKVRSGGRWVFTAKLMPKSVGSRGGYTFFFKVDNEYLHRAMYSVDGGEHFLKNIMDTMTEGIKTENRKRKGAF